MPFTHAEVLQNLLMLSPEQMSQADHGPYELIRGSGIPERGNFDYALKAGETIIEGEEMRSPFIDWTDDQMDAVVNTIIHLTGLKDLTERLGYPTAKAQEVMDLFWTLDGWKMEDMKMKQWETV